MKEFTVSAIGEVVMSGGSYALKLKPGFRDGLTALQGFSHINVIWWANHCDDPEQRAAVLLEKPYKKGPEKIGVFATRSPARPNPVAVTVVYVIRIDPEEGMIYTPYIDAEPGTPVLDIKPYSPCTDITRQCTVPGWCSHWPASIEESADFNWGKEFNF